MMCWLVVALMSAGGILVALSVKLADSIAKTIAVAGAVGVSTLLEWALMGGNMTREIVIGVVVTIISILLSSPSSIALPLPVFLPST